MIKGRKNWKQKLRDKFGDNDAKVAWFHAASLGEFEQTRPLIEEFHETWPDFRILITFFSPSGYEVRKSFQPSYYVTYIPFDSKKNAEFWVDTIKPSIVFFAKYEFWFHFSSSLKQRNIPLISFSSIFRKEQLYFSWHGGFYRNILKNFDHFFVQNKESVELLTGIGINQVEQVGDTRFDRVLHISATKSAIENLDDFKSGRKLFVCGSIWESDMGILSELIQELQSEYKFVLAPHEISESNINLLMGHLKTESIKYSTYNGELEKSVMFLDTMGMLSSVYGYANAAYIGGAFEKGLHNILEASVYKIPVFFGDGNYKKFNEANELIELGVAFPVNNGKKIIDTLKQIEGEGDLMSEKISEYFTSKKGATERIISYTRELLHP